MAVEFEQSGSVAIFVLDNPPVNALSAAVRTELTALFESTLARPDIKAIVLAAKGRHFSAGADLREFGAPPRPDAPQLPHLIERLEQSPLPVVAALSGTVAGGATELALGCHYRVAANDLAMSLPEVTLGFIPGAGGTQRLPRLAGLSLALDLILSGRAIGASEAAGAGIVDLVAGRDELRARAIAFARNAAAQPTRPTGARPAPVADAAMLAQAAEKLRREARGRRAPQAALECIVATLAMPFAAGLAHEREVFKELLGGPESRALRHVFFAERDAPKVAGIDPRAPVRPIRTAGVVGFGTMGSGIAMAFANAGIPVRVLEANDAALQRGLATVRSAYDAAHAKGRISAAERDARRDLVSGVAEYAAFADADLVVEAVFEEMDVKHTVFRDLDAVCRTDAILATNTSSLDVNAIAAATAHPGRVLGLHFFSPAQVMRLVEVVRPAAVDIEVLATAMALVKHLGKLGVAVGVCDSFAANRSLYAYRRQSDFLVEEGASPLQVDSALRAFGMPMGPFQTGDMVGLDVSWRIRRRQAATRDPSLRYSPIADRLCELGRFGQKTGAGWYRYEKGSREPLPDPQVDALIAAISNELGIARRAVSDAEIVERSFFALVNECARILEEGLVARPGDLDVIWIHGYGFPRHRGGPMHWADGIGLARILAAVEAMNREQGDLVKPSALLRDLARTGRSFADIGGK